MGVFVRSCEARRNIGSVEAFTKALLAAKSTAYNDPVSGAPGALYPADLKPKTRHFDPGGAEAAVALSEVELGLSQVTVILASLGI